MSDIKHPYLKNRIARVDRHLSSGGFGHVYQGELENLFGLIAERFCFGELSLAPLLNITLPPGSEDGKPVSDPELRNAAMVSSFEQWGHYRARLKENADQALQEFHDILQYIDPAFTSKKVAIKVLRPPMGDAQDKDLEQRMYEQSRNQFLRESKLLSTLNHPNIVRHLGLVIDPNYGQCMMLEYLDGKSLKDYLADFGPLPAEHAVQIALGIADALEYCHDDKQHPVILHRDLKPANVMLDENLRPILIDFGLGKFADTHQTQLTMANTAMGTPRYMPPEQWEDASRATPATDVYALAGILYEMLTGESAYTTDDQTTLRKMVPNLKLPHPKGLRDFDHLKNVSRKLEDLVEIGRRKDPSKRWTIHEFIQQARSIWGTRTFEQEPEEPKTYTQLCVMKKIHDWRTDQIETKIHYLRIEEGLKEARNLIKAKDYSRATEKLTALSTDLLPLPTRFDGLKKQVLRTLTGLAYLEYRAGYYPEGVATLELTKSYLELFPAAENTILHGRNKAVQRRLETHKPMVDALTMIRRTFISDIRTKIAELTDLNAPLLPEKLNELCTNLAIGKTMFESIDPQKIGTSAHAQTKKDIEQLSRLLKSLAAPTAV